MGLTYLENDLTLWDYAILNSSVALKRLNSNKRLQEITNKEYCPIIRDENHI